MNLDPLECVIFANSILLASIYVIIGLFSVLLFYYLESEGDWMDDILLDLSDFSEIGEITLEATPNQSFNCDINSQNFEFEIRTMLNGDSFISIKSGDSSYIDLASIKTGVNLCYATTLKSVSFFFLANTSKTLTRPYNYSDFDTNIKLYYGIVWL